MYIYIHRVNGWIFSTLERDLEVTGICANFGI